MHKNLVRKPGEKRQHGESRRRWEDNIRRDSREIGWEGVQWIYLAQDRNQWRIFTNTVTNFRFPLKAGNFLIK
jgi:hypothetical protein